MVIARKPHTVETDLLLLSECLCLPQIEVIHELVHVGHVLHDVRLLRDGSVVLWERMIGIVTNW